MSDLDKIFKAYDIRGIYPEEINEEIAYKIGRATAKFLKTKEIVIGQDKRSSSKNLFRVLSEGVRDEGVNVIDIGLATTPMFYFSVVKWKVKGGIMITASHNPPKYNGFKVIREKAAPVGEDSGLKKIKKIIEKSKFKDKNRGELKRREILKKYIENVLKYVNLKKIKPFKVNVNTSDGVAEIVIPVLFKRISATLRKGKTDLGVVFDGDGDRINFLNEKGQRISPDLITSLLIHHFFKNAGKILYTSIASWVVREEIGNTNNSPICSKVGHTFVKEKMDRGNIVFGAESSGHYYFRDNYFLDSPLIVLMKLLEILSKTKMPISKLVQPFQKYYQEKLNFKIDKGMRVIRRIEKKYKKSAKISRFDGLTIEFSDWWFNLRPSNTEPVIRLTIEAKIKDLLEQKKKELSRLIKSD